MRRSGSAPGSAHGVCQKTKPYAINAIIFGNSTAGLRPVSSEGGAVTSLTTLDAAQGESAHSSPALVPSSRAVLFAAFDRGTTARIDAVMLDSGKRTLVLENARGPLALSSGHLIFERNGELFIAPFDAKRLTVTGPAVPLGEQICCSVGRFNNPEMSVSRNGTFAYLSAVDTSGALGLVGRQGTFQPLGLPPGNIDRPRVSPDGRSIAYLTNNELYVYDLERGSTGRRTQDGRDYGVAWHPDGRSLAINSKRDNGASGIYLRKPDGTDQLLVPLAAGVTILWNFSWSPDGKQLAYTVQEGGLTHIWILTMGEKPPTQPFMKGQAKSPKFSPDGKWLAYDSSESGRSEVYLQQYPQGERVEVSTGGGDGPVWRRDGKELFFQGYAGDAQKKTLAATVTPNGASLRLGKPVPLFDLRTTGPAGDAWQYSTSSNAGAGYDVLPDGRFVMVRSRPRPTFARSSWCRTGLKN